MYNWSRGSRKTINRQICSLEHWLSITLQHICNLKANLPDWVFLPKHAQAANGSRIQQPCTGIDVRFDISDLCFYFDFFCRLDAFVLKFRIQPTDEWRSKIDFATHIAVCDLHKWFFFSLYLDYFQSAQKVFPFIGHGMSVWRPWSVRVLEWKLTFEIFDSIRFNFIRHRTDGEHRINDGTRSWFVCLCVCHRSHGNR